jgi:hypothetical protein
VRTAYNLADPMTKHVKNRHFDKLLHTTVVDHLVEEYFTRAQMTHNSPFEKEDMLSVDVSIFVGSACSDPKLGHFFLSAMRALYISKYCVLCCL